MKTKNMRDLEKYWAEKAKKSAKSNQPKTAPKNKSREDVSQAASGIEKEATKE